ncbi:MAG: hypothetical protein JWQ19_3930 [Subtercola sp.]|nr:hypothetical protein [Subtercola sp.]
MARKKAPALCIVARHKVVLAASHEAKSTTTVTPALPVVERPFRTVLAPKAKWPQ